MGAFGGWATLPARRWQHVIPIFQSNGLAWPASWVAMTATIVW
jgi:hypothetical protein